MRYLAAVEEEGRLVAIVGAVLLRRPGLENGGDNELPCRVAGTAVHRAIVEQPTVRKKARVKFRVTPIGLVHNSRLDPADTDHWGDVVSSIVIDERFGDDCLVGLSEFSHVEVVFLFDRMAERSDYSARRSRGRADMPEVGVFAARGPGRPNRIGVTTSELLTVGERELVVRGLDAVDGTPVLDVKPVIREFLPRGVRQPDWATTLMREYFDS